MQERELYGFGGFVLDAHDGVLRGERGIVGLPPKAIATLLALVERRGEVISKRELMDAVWPETFVEEGNLTQNIFLLRKELGKTAEGEDYIQTLSKRGYRLTVPVVAMERPGTKLEVAAMPAAPEGGVTAPAGSAAAEIRGKERAGRRQIAWLSTVLVLLACGLGLRWFWRMAWARPAVSGFTQITHDGLVKRGHLITVGGPDAALFTDGARLYFTEGSTEAPILAEVSAVGGETARIGVAGASLAQPQLLDLSLKRSELLVSSGVNPAAFPGLWVVPVPGGTARQLGGSVAGDGSWSPDGERLAFLRGADLYVAKRDGSDARKVATMPGPGWMPRWSPDSKLIRLTIFDLQQSVTALWEIGVDGRGLRRLLEGWNRADGPMDVCCGSWTPKGEEFVFQATRLGRSEIWAMREGVGQGMSGWTDGMLRLMNQDLDEPVQLTHGQLSSLAPALSPDGRKLFVIGQQLRSEMERYDARTGEFVPYGAPALSGISADFVDVSRDGKWLAYVDFPGGTLWRCRMDGSERMQLTSPPMQVMVPLWSPDGTRIVFYGYNAGRQQQGYVVDMHGGEPMPTQQNGSNQMTSNWSPDGQSLMYSDFPFFVQDRSAIAVHIVNLATQKVETLPGSRGFFDGTWSPDGSHAAAWGPNGRDLMVFDFKTRIWTKMGEGGGFIKWSRDGAYAYFLRQGPDSAIMQVRMSDRRMSEFVSLKGIRLAGRLAGVAFALTPEGDPLVLRDVGTQEIYSLDWHGR